MAASNGGIGGFLASGGIDLFVSAVVLALGYELFLAWLHQGQPLREEQRRADRLHDIATLLSLSKEEPEQPVSPTDPVGPFHASLLA
jgi:hypothetical protein